MPRDADLIKHMLLQIARLPKGGGVSASEIGRGLSRGSSRSRGLLASKSHSIVAKDRSAASPLPDTPKQPTENEGKVIVAVAPSDRRLPGQVDHDAGKKEIDQSSRRSVEVGGDTEPEQAGRDLPDAPAPVPEESNEDSGSNGSSSSSASGSDSSSGSSSDSSDIDSSTSGTWRRSGRTGTTGTYRSEASSSQFSDVQLVVQGSQLRIRGVGSEWSPELHNHFLRMSYGTDRGI